MEHVTGDGTISIDVAIVPARIAVEANGPSMMGLMTDFLKSLNTLYLSETPKIRFNSESSISIETTPFL